MQDFVIHDLYWLKNKIGTFKVYSDKNLEIVLKDGLDEFVVPFELCKSYRAGNRKFDTESVMKWVVERVVPSGRHNISEILKAANLEEYDELDLFLYYHGRSVMDDYSLDTPKPTYNKGEK